MARACAMRQPATADCLMLMGESNENMFDKSTFPALYALAGKKDFEGEHAVCGDGNEKLSNEIKAGREG